MKYFRKAGGLFLAGMLLALRAAADSTPSPKAPADLRAAVGRRAVRALTEALSDDDAEVRAAAAKAFGDIGNPAAAGVLRRALQDKNLSVRVEAGYALYRLGLPEGVAAIRTVVEQGVKPETQLSPAERLKLMARNESRVLGIERLSAVGGVDVVKLFEATLKDPSGAVRDATAVALARLGFDEYSQQFLAALKSPDESVRAAAVSALGQIGQPSGLDALSTASKDSSVAVREEAMRALARFPGEDSSRWLAAGVKDSDARVRAQALAGLARLSDADSAPLLREALKTDTSMQSQLEALTGLARRGELPAGADLSVVDGALAEKDFDLRLLAVEALSAIDTNVSTARLLRVVDEDRDGRVRVSAAAALVERLGRRASPK